MLSLLVARSRRLDLAEDALGEAFARATSRWPTDGVPKSPSAWLYRTASRLIVGALRAEAMAGRKAALLAVDASWEAPPPGLGAAASVDDERLAVILLCCHPALHVEARSPLALRLVVGTSTAEIARLFLVPTATMAARLTRAKKKIVAAGIPLSMPVDQAFRLRLNDVCRTIYLAFTAGYTPGSGAELLRSDLAGDAVELAAVLHRLTPDHDEATALFALLTLQHARRDARVSNGQLSTLADQDRSLWHRAEIDSALAMLHTLDPGEGYREELRLQALIAAEHAKAADAVDTDWRAIAGSYARLEALTGSAVVRLNRAVAVAEVDGAAAGLELLEGLEETLPASHRLHAVRAEFARRCGRDAAARADLQRAIELCANEVERDHLSARLSALGDRSG